MAIGKLALADGTVLTGEAFGAEGETYGEVVFNTSMTGYQEILTDPSYTGQIVTMTYPQIGNYGVNDVDVESDRPRLSGFLIKELCDFPSNFRCEQSLSDYLKQHGIIALQGLDTRALVRRIRVHGAMTGVLSTTDLDDASLIEKAQNAPELSGVDFVKQVVPEDVNNNWDQSLDDLAKMPGDVSAAVDENSPHVVAIDYGMKWNIPRHLKECGCRLTVVPGTATAEEILALNPDGVFLSNGPGDPRPLTYAIETIQKLLPEKPLFGICLGQQLLGLAMGGEIYKLKFGHRGGNQPVRNQQTGQVEITSQNHGFAINAETLPDDVEVTHLNLNDNTVAGLRHKSYPAFGVQYHPESSAGPHDSRYLFDQFVEMMTSHANA